ncbi:unnamed protein product [Trichobilharzia regenti]|nr:unnamed protein product [Trichobilharzia regenti]
MDEIAGSVDRLGESQVSGLLPLLSRVESTFKYRHYQMSQALTNDLMDDFSNWCIYRLIVIACRPQFTYHLEIVGDQIKSLMLLLERHHLDIYLKRSLHLVSVLQDLLGAMELSDQKVSHDFHWKLKAPDSSKSVVCHDESDELKFLCSPVELTTLKEAYRLVSILSAVELTDVYGKQVVSNVLYVTS